MELEEVAARYNMSSIYYHKEYVPKHHLSGLSFGVATRMGGSCSNAMPCLRVNPVRNGEF
jgi:hypothetical protein